MVDIVLLQGVRVWHNREAYPPWIGHEDRINPNLVSYQKTNPDDHDVVLPE